VKRGSIGGFGGGGAPRPSGDGSTFQGKWCGFLPSPSLRRSGGPPGRSGGLGGGVGVEDIALERTRVVLVLYDSVGCEASRVRAEILARELRHEPDAPVRGVERGEASAT
jgi:hypothetical protein